ncbi:MAG: glycerol-3-phosphate acyltransferase [Anaerolineales bacterium]|jgi:glycerol-3-phosphate acyltransferase PlsY
MNVSVWVLMGLAYLMGSFPTAYVMGRRQGVNLRLTGDGNLGTKNSFESLGPVPGILVGVVDAFKGAAAVHLAQIFTVDPLVPYLAAVAVAVGHDYSIFIRFQGGQGMAAILGGLLMLQPWVTMLGIAIAGVVLLITSNWDLSWVLGLGSVEAVGLFLHWPLWQAVMVALIFLTIGVKKLVDAPLRARIRGGQ